MCGSGPVSWFRFDTYGLWTGRICYGVELEEKFVDVIVNRYMEMKGSADDVFVIRNNVKISYRDLGKEGEVNATADLP